jgi:hypothetical protein
LFIEGRPADAQKEFERFLREYPESPWLPQAALGIASSLGAQGRTNDAIAKYEEVRRRFGNDPVVDEVKLSLGRLFEGQGKNEEAFKMYDEVMKGGMAMQSGLAVEAQLRQQELVKRFPALAVPKMPVMPPATPGANASNVQVVRMTNPVTRMTNTLQRPATNVAQRAVTNAAVTNVPLLLTPKATNK